MSKRERTEEELHRLETVAQRVGGLIGGAIDSGDSGALFALLMFTPGEEGWMTWVSNAERPDMVKALREMADKLEAGLDMPPGSSHRKH
jgi:hypothetical protein